MQQRFPFAAPVLRRSDVREGSGAQATVLRLDLDRARRRAQRRGRASPSDDAAFDRELAARLGHDAYAPGEAGRPRDRRERLPRGAALAGVDFAGDGVRFARAARAVREALGQPHRYAHIVRVARLAAGWRARTASTRCARALAGMLHDLARL